MIRNPYATVKKAPPAISLRPLYQENDETTKALEHEAPADGEEAHPSDATIASTSHDDSNGTTTATAATTASTTTTASTATTTAVSVDLPHWKRLPSLNMVSAEILTVSELLQWGHLYCGRPVRLLVAAATATTTTTPSSEGAPAKCNPDTCWISVVDPLTSVTPASEYQNTPQQPQPQQSHYGSTSSAPRTTTKFAPRTQPPQPNSNPNNAKHNNSLKRRSSLPAPRPLPSSVSSTSRKSLPASFSRVTTTSRAGTVARSLLGSKATATPMMTTTARKRPRVTAPPAALWVALDPAVSWVHTSLGSLTNTTTGTHLVTLVGTVAQSTSSSNGSFYLQARIVRALASTANVALQQKCLLQRRQFIYTTTTRRGSGEERTGETTSTTTLRQGCGPPPYPPPMPRN